MGKPRAPISTWPTRPLEEPHVLLNSPQSKLVDGGVILLAGLGRVTKYDADHDHDLWLPPEFYFWELRDLDTTDAEAVLEFVRTWGALVIGDMGLQSGEYGSVIQEAQARFARIVQNAGADPSRACAVEEVAFVVAVLRDAVRGLLWRAGKLSTAELEESWESPMRMPIEVPKAVLERIGTSSSALRFPAARFATYVVSAGLGPFHPRVVLGKRPATPSTVPLYNAICLQILNDLMLDPDYQTCRRCRRPFIRQRGRASYGQHRTRGKRTYCSVRCANAATAQDKRDRDRAAKGEAS